jgi:ketosteroid isomerase-like protein
MSKKIIMPILSFAALLLSSCSSPEKPVEVVTTVIKDSSSNFDPVAMQKLIEPRLKAFATAFTSGDSAGMVGMYTPDARIMPPNSPLVSGREAIGKMVGAYMKFGVKEFKDSTTALYGDRDNLIEEGVYSMGDGKGHLMDQGKYVEVWRQAEGQWKIYVDIFNSNLPVPKSGK